MRTLFLAFALCPSLALAGPTDGIYRNDKATMLEVQGATDAGFDFSLTAGAPDGGLACPKGETNCLHIGGHATAGGKGFTFIDPDDDHNRVFLAADDTGFRVLSTTGDFGTGSGNRAQMLALTGAYALVPDMSGAGDEDLPAPDMSADTSTDTSTDTSASDQPQDLHFFQSPTGNIACLFVVGQTTEVRCDLLQLNRSFTRPPKDCDLDWGDSFDIASGDQKGSLFCHGDTVKDPTAEVLDYGSTLYYGDVTCQSDKTGMTCQNAQGHGFAISRKRQEVF